ncbi:MAG: ABC transporter ATP-binding protein [Alphaproteobacteria bacterium]|nr:ABC transporter ATP-binding protein [Alphaproteobacteria bacterium]
MSLLALEEIAVALAGRTVLGPVTLKIVPGEIVGIVGPNGAGKTTLLRAIAGLVPLRHGALSIGDRRVERWSQRERARLVSYLPQGAPAHWPLAVERIVALGRLPHLSPWQSPAARDRDAIARAVQATEIAPLLARAVTTLSMGERTRVMLARALAVDAPILLADEPVASLDPGHQLRVMDVLKERAMSGGAVVVVLHDLTLAGRFCHRLVVLDAGKVVAAGGPREVLDAALLERVYGVSAMISGPEQPFFVVPDRRLASVPSQP